MSYTRTFQRLITIFIAMSALILIVFFVKHPEQVFQAALQGVRIWWGIVFPALLPFLIINEMMIAQGTLRLFGRLFEPITRKLWGLPGITSYTVAIGWISGFPAAARLTGELRRNDLITRHEGERMLALTHMANPIFLVIIIAEGFLHDARIGWLLIAIHWLSLAILGIVLRIRLPGHHREPTQSNAASVLATFVMPTDKRTFGKLMGDAVARAIDQLMMIGGIMTFFSVIVTIIQLSLTALTMHVPSIFIHSLFEIHLGAYDLSLLQGISYPFLLACMNAAIGWSGIAAHVQAQAFLIGTNLRYTHFLIARVLHAFLAFMITLLCVVLFKSMFIHSSEVMRHNGPLPLPSMMNTWEAVIVASIFCAGMTCALIVSVLAIVRAKVR